MIGLLWHVSRALCVIMLVAFLQPEPDNDVVEWNGKWWCGRLYLGFVRIMRKSQSRRRGAIMMAEGRARSIDRKWGCFRRNVIFVSISRNCEFESNFDAFFSLSVYFQVRCPFLESAPPRIWLSNSRKQLFLGNSLSTRSRCDLDIFVWWNWWMFCRGRNVNKFILKFMMILKASFNQNGSSQLSKPSNCWARSSIDSYLELFGEWEAINHNSSSIDGGRL